MGELPKISIVTPSYNCGRFIRQCIDSVLAQDYPNFEHIIIDGASKDDTVEVLKSYSHLRWISEPDSGEAEALNKALALSTGDVVGWLNSDDYYTPGALQRVGEEFGLPVRHHVIYGNTIYIDEVGNFMRPKVSAANVTLPLLLRWWQHRRHPHQPAMFYSRKLIETVGPYRQDLYYGIDYDYWLRISRHFAFHHVDQTLAVAREHHDSKSWGTEGAQETALSALGVPYREFLSPAERRAFWFAYAFERRIAQPCVSAVWSVVKRCPPARAAVRSLLRARGGQ